MVAAVGIGLVVAAFAAFGPVVRARIATEAERRGLEVDVSHVRPGFFAIVLRDVRAKPRGVSGIDVRLDEVRVELTALLRVREVAARGGEIRIDGDPGEVADRIRELRRPSGGARSGGDSTSRVVLTAEGVSLAWRAPSGTEVTASGLRAHREAGTTKLGCVRCSAVERHVRIDVEDADAELGDDGALRRLTVSSVRVVHQPPPRVAPKAEDTGPATEPTPPPLPTTAKHKSAAPAASGAPAVGAAPTVAEPVLPLPDLHALRTRIAAALAASGAKVPAGALVEVGGLSAKVDVGGEALAFGPGAFTLARRGDLLHVTFASDKTVGDGKSGTPLSLDADLPLGAGDVTARLSGGPVSLAALGVKEGAHGLFDVARGTISGKGQLVLSAGGDALTFDGQLALRAISMKNPRISTEPVRDLELDVSGRGVLDDGGRLRIDDAQLDMKALHVRAHGTVEETRDHFALSLSTEVAPAACQALVESSPPGLLPTVRGMRMTGTFGASSRVVFDTRAIDKLVLDYEVNDQCRVVEVPRELSRERFANPFTYRTYHADGTPGESTTGPGTPAWTALDDISPFMIAAVLTTEDGAFYKHRGFNHHAIRSSVQANLRARRFVRGASTITMQLAKNLFLSREKTLSRKIEEVILTDYLEQVFRKDDMMELYLNVVEFGPDVYGITEAADHYFSRKPDELNLAECFFLATLLPAPTRYGKLREKGEVTESWMRHLQALMEIAAKSGKITRAELEAAVGQRVVFPRPGDPRPEPRRPFTRERRDPYGDDAAWQPLD